MVFIYDACCVSVQKNKYFIYFGIDLFVSTKAHIYGYSNKNFSCSYYILSTEQLSNNRGNPIRAENTKHWSNKRGQPITVG